MLKLLLYIYIAAAFAVLPLPSAPQVAWQQGEIMALIHFNMATFFEDGDPGCTSSNWEGATGSSNPSSFAPTNLNVSSWVDSMVELGVTEAVLTAKHGCGFYLWNTNVSVGSYGRYDYHVETVTYGDVLRQFVDATSARGIGHGFYYSLTNNFKLNVHTHSVQPGPLLPGQLNVTQQEFEDFAFDSVSELWSAFGSLTEIWFDGGYSSDMESRIKVLLAATQPGAVAFGGYGISQNPARWCGTEGGNPAGLPEIWSTACDGYANCAPNVTGAAYAPSAVDFTLQQGDHWFYTPGDDIHSLSDLIDVYHNSVGHNGKLELDFAISRTGQLAPTHAARYAEFGAWIRACYGSPIASVSPPVGATSVEMQLSATPVTVDRVAMREDLTFGQIVYGYTVEYDAGDGAWQTFSTGLSVGNKRIDVLAAPVNATRLRLTLSNPLGPSHLLSFSAFSPSSCLLPSTRVRFQSPDGRCLVSNATFPCTGGADNSCPTFLGACDAPSSVWDDGSGQILNPWATALGGTAGLNVDCDQTSAGTVVKLLGLNAGGWNNFVFQSGQILYGETGLCFDGGQGPFSPPCGHEPRASDQISVQPCGSATTAGWNRVVV
jgi:alpha-L-fucosidase